MSIIYSKLLNNEVLLKNPPFLKEVYQIYMLIVSDMAVDAGDTLMVPFHCIEGKQKLLLLMLYQYTFFRTNRYIKQPCISKYMPCVYEFNQD